MRIAHGRWMVRLQDGAGCCGVLFGGTFPARTVRPQPSRPGASCCARNCAYRDVLRLLSFVRVRILWLRAHRQVQWPVHRAGRGALWTDISPTTYSYGSDAICTQTRLSMVHADAMPTFSEADNRRSPEPTKVQPHHVASERTKRVCHPVHPCIRAV